MVSARICSTNKFRFFPTAGILSTRDSVKSIVLTMVQVKLSLIVASPPLSHLSSIHVPRSPSTNINYRKKKRQKRSSTTLCCVRMIRRVNSDLDVKESVKTIFPLKDTKNCFFVFFISSVWFWFKLVTL